MYILGKNMTDRHSIAEARSNLPKLVREAEHGKAVELTRRGEPVAVLIGRRQFEQLTSSYRSFAAAYRDFSKEFDLPGLAIDPDELFGDTREETPGRKVRL
jgi:prevent-host-death family protein